MLIFNKKNSGNLTIVMFSLKVYPTLLTQPLRLYNSYRCFTTSSTLLKSASSKRWLDRQSGDYFTRRAKIENFKSRAAFKLLQIDEKFNIFGSKFKSKTNLSHKSNNKPINVLDLGAAPGAWNQVAIERCPPKSKILGVDILPYQPPNGASTIQGNILSKGTQEQIKNFFILSRLENKDRVFDEVEIISKADRRKILTTFEHEVSIVEQEAEVGKLIGEKLNKNKLTDLPDSSLNLNEDNLALTYPVNVILSDMYVPYVRDSGFGNATTNNPYFRMANTTGLALRDHVMSMDLCDAALITAIDLLKKNGHLVMKFFTGEDDVLLEKRLKIVFHDVKRFKPRACRVESKECYFVCLNKRAYEVDKVDLFSKKL